MARGEKGEPWTGVRNYQARNNMRAMKLGDRGFFYHSNIGKEIVGIVEVVALAHPDPGDDTGTWECVDVRRRVRHAAARHVWPTSRPMRSSPTMRLVTSIACPCSR